MVGGGDLRVMDSPEWSFLLFRMLESRHCPLDAKVSKPEQVRGDISAKMENMGEPGFARYWVTTSGLESVVAGNQGYSADRETCCVLPSIFTG